MIRAAGMMFVTPDDKVLLMHRVAKAEQDGDISGVWAFPGGGIEGEETAEDAARREIQEETGLDYDGVVKLWTRRIRDEVDFTTFLSPINEPFAPKMNDEHDAYQWVDRHFALSSSLLHPGVYIALNRFQMDELAVAKAIRDGELSSPQAYENLLLIALRITGTGMSYRSAHKEYVWRDASIYMNPEFLERCNGLPVILQHPKKSLLNTEEFRDRISGTIFVPYLKPEAQEVWGIAKILDMEVAEMLKDEVMSTSPAVLCLGDKVTMAGGENMLVEDKPHLLDHLALCPLGVWDRGGPPMGVESIDAERADSALDVILHRAKLNEIVNRI